MTAHAAAPGGSRTRRLAAVLGLFAVAEVAAAAALTPAVGWGWQDALEGFVVTNSLMGASFAVCGAVIAWHRPRLPVGWLFVAGGVAHATTACAMPLTEALRDDLAPVPLRLLVTVATWAWPWSIGLCLPLALLLFPDGRPPGPRWRPAVLAVAVTSPLFALELGMGDEPLEPGLPLAYGGWSGYDRLQPLWTASEARTMGALALAVAALAVRYRKGGETQRLQLMWLLLAATVAVAVTLPWAFVAGTPVVVLLAIPLIPAAVAVGIVRHRLFDIRLVLSRALTWLLLTAGVIGAYAGLVALLDTFVAERVGRSAVATVVVALAVAPVLPRLRRLVDRAMYGDRGDPARVASRVGRRLQSGADAGLPDVVAAVRTALRLPYAALRGPDGAVVAEDGAAGDGPAEGVTVQALDLEYGGGVVGGLIVGLRPGERELDPADRDVLTLLAAPLAVALHALGLTAELQRSRERIVAAREEERRRLHRDLHDGLGPLLTGVALSADAAANLVVADPAGARRLMDALRSDTRTAIADVRRLVDNLRPPALDELGLVGALRQRTDRLAVRGGTGGVAIRVDAPAEVPELPAAVEVAAYRIATEALTNVVRHSGADSAVVRLRCAGSLDVEVLDDGPPNGPWHPGVGLTAMRERATELGGAFTAGPTPAGGRVHVSFPLAAT
ncbi:sensor histidine kinase [Streptomyces sp. NPDC051940]|uniref:sensor histidine kinase n=1 Tax=Streptomyces sp. NPDC051940 TaxID=3155675 RepID=UPI003426084F